MSKNKLLIIVASCFAVIALVLTVIILKLNNGDSGSAVIESEKVETDGVEANSTAVSNTNITAQENESDKTNTSKADKTNGIKPEIPDGDTSDALTTDKTKSGPGVTKLCEYKGISLEYSPVIISDEMVDNQLDILKNENTEVVDLPDRAFQEGDMAIVTFEGKIDGYRPDDFLGVCVQDVLGMGVLPDTFESAIIGRRIGDKFQVDLAFPEDYTLVPEAAGKTVPFDIVLEDGFMFKVPEINDSFISSVTEYKDLSSYREGTRNKLQAEENKIAYNATLLSMRHMLIDGSEFSDAVENEIKLAYVSVLNNESQYITENYFVDAGTFYQIEYGMSLEEYQKKMMDDLTIDIKYSYILDKIIASEGITDSDITDEEFETAFNTIYIDSGSYFTKDSVYTDKSEAEINKSVKTQVLRDRAEKIVMNSAIINGENKIPWDR